MKNYLIISICGCGFFMIPHLAQAMSTKKVYFYPVDTKMKKLGKGMNKYPGWEKLEVVKDPFEAIKKEAKEDLVIIFDDNGWGEMADHLRKEGYGVVGGGALADYFENDRWGTIQYMKKIMKVPETEYHESFESGITSLKAKEKDEKWVFKPQDADVPKDKTYVGKDISDLIDAMKKFEAEWEWKDGFVLQKFVDGIEVSLNCYFDGTDWIPDSFGWYFENKPFMTGNNGPATGGEVAVQVWRKNEGDAFSLLDKMKPILTKADYHGQMDINCIFSKEDKEPYFLELTPRFGYPGIDMEITAMEEDNKSFASFMNAIAYGGSKTDWFPKDKIATTIVVSAPPYPSDEGAEKMVTGLPVSWAKKWDKYIFPWFIQYNEKKKQLEAMGYSGHLFHVTCIDTTLAGAVAMTYDTYIPSINLQNKQFRTDLGESAKKRITELKEMGVLS